ncbi:MAG: signal peptide peptidase SppA [Burkholderiales bacterium]|nr:signal peptide peptidase SppA [Phycisphaerae bacterium]
MLKQIIAASLVVSSLCFAETAPDPLPPPSPMPAPSPTTPPMPLPVPNDLPNDVPSVPAPAIAEPARTPATLPTTAPATAPSAQKSSPSTQPSAWKKFPTPGELARLMMAKKTEEQSKIQVAYFNLSQTFREKPSEFSLFGDNAPTLREFIERLELARDDQSIKAVLFYIGSGTGLQMAQAQEVSAALSELRRAGKKTFVYADTYDTASYMLASAATNICLMEGGEVFVPGIGFETMFFKGALDKLGVHADYVQIGEYKGAEEPFTRTEPSTELSGEMNKLVDAYFRQIVDTISLHRGLTNENVKRVIDDAMISAKQAKAAGWVDHLVDSDGLRDLMKSELGDEVNIVHDYGDAASADVDTSNPFAIFQLLNRKPVVSEKPQIAIVYAAGTIVDGRGGDGLFGGSSIGSEDIRRAMRIAGRDEKVKAVVIRIDSPGGSALASEAMWQSVRHVSANKPVIISIGSMAASGGYYLASAGDYVVADPAAIVGSIGVVGGKFVLTDLYEKLGITTTDFKRGQNADLFSSNTRFDDRQKRMIRTWMRNTYDQFTDRIRETRGNKIKNIDDIARGRIFLAADAKELGMVDELGGLATAITHAAGDADMEYGEYDVTVLPPPMTLADYISGRSDDDAAMPFSSPLILTSRSSTPGVSAPHVKLEIKADSLLHSLPRNIRTSLSQQLDLMRILEDRPVALMAPFVMTTK